MYKKDDILAIVTTYECDNSIIENVLSIAKQVSKVVIIDDGSNEESRKILDTIRHINYIEIIYKKENMGLANSLNIGLEIAKKQKYSLIFTLDQDTLLLANAIESLLKVLNMNNKIVSVGGKWDNKENDITLSNNYISKYTYVKYLITSGSLSIISKIIEVGGYEDQLFIDSIDFDISLKLCKAGYKIAKISECIMVHKIGKLEEINIFGKKKNISLHNPIRYYYIFRNTYYINEKYILFSPIFCLKKDLMSIIEILKIILFDKEKYFKFKMILYGIKDARKGIYGKYRKRIQ